MKSLKRPFIVSIIYAFTLIVLVAALWAVLYGSFDYFRQAGVDGVSTPEFWMIFALGALFAVMTTSFILLFCAVVGIVRMIPKD